MRLTAVLVLALCGVAAARSAASLRGRIGEPPPPVVDISKAKKEAPILAPHPDPPKRASTKTLDAIQTQAEKFDCAHAGDTMENIFLKIQKNIVGRINNLTSACGGRMSHVDAAAEADKAAHQTSMAEEEAALRAKIMAPLGPMTAEVAKAKKDRTTAITDATAENVTAWKALKASREKIERLQKEFADAQQAHADTVNRTGNELAAAVENSTAEYTEAVDAAQEALDAMTVQAKEASAKTIKRCDANKGEDDIVNAKHQALVDKVTPLVAALKKCRSGQKEDKATTALLEVNDPCEEMEGQVQASLIEVAASPPAEEKEAKKSYDGSLQQVVDKVATKTREAQLRHQKCVGKAHKLSNETVGNATKDFAETRYTAKAEKTAADIKAGLAKNTTDAAALKVATDLANALADEQERLEGGELTPEAGVADEAARQRATLKSTIEEQDELVATAQAGLDDETARLNGIMDAETKRLNEEREDADALTAKMTTSSKKAIKKACDLEKQLLNDERTKTEELYEQYFKEVGAIDVNADKVITTTPKPVPEPSKLAGDDLTKSALPLVAELEEEDFKEGGEALCARHGRVVGNMDTFKPKDCQWLGNEWGTKQVVIGKIPVGFGYEYGVKDSLHLVRAKDKKGANCEYDDFEGGRKFKGAYPTGQFFILCMPKGAAPASTKGADSVAKDVKKIAEAAKVAAASVSGSGSSSEAAKPEEATKEEEAKNNGAKEDAQATEAKEVKDEEKIGRP